MKFIFFAFFILFSNFLFSNLVNISVFDFEKNRAIGATYILYDEENLIEKGDVGFSNLILNLESKNYLLFLISREKVTTLIKLNISQDFSLNAFLLKNPVSYFIGKTNCNKGLRLYNQNQIIIKNADYFGDFFIFGPIEPGNYFLKSESCFPDFKIPIRIDKNQIKQKDFFYDFKEQIKDDEKNKFKINDISNNFSNLVNKENNESFKDKKTNENFYNLDILLNNKSNETLIEDLLMIFLLIIFSIVFYFFAFKNKKSKKSKHKTKIKKKQKNKPNTKKTIKTREKTKISKKNKKK